MSEAHTPDGPGQHSGEHQRPDPGAEQRTDPRAARRRANERAAAQPGGAQPGRSRLGGLWSVFVVAAVVLLLLLVFILENSQDVQISYFGVAGTLPLGVALLLSAILGVLLVAVPGYARIIQLRRSAKRGSGRG
ncbi:LapA family protein [Crossiella cryophila]|uniref:Putative integral membrane protein n=1 Tax=Crossiella cryophila TaxID=43355 RepID=A0A7W7FTD9_9PSEU|nr:LapA family protein [Crossiella cryophila]MBB4676313.1 putative integral membrane protein [Crossiella cryophila]